MSISGNVTGMCEAESNEPLEGCCAASTETLPSCLLAAAFDAVMGIFLFFPLSVVVADMTSEL